MISYEFGWPLKALSPNARVHWRTLAKAKVGYKEECEWVIFASEPDRRLRAEERWRQVPPVTAQVTFVCDVRRRDPDNHMAMLKPLWDALVEMGVLEDDSHDKLRILDPKWERGPKKVVVTLEGSDG